MSAGNNQCLEDCLATLYRIMLFLQDQHEAKLLRRVKQEIESLHFDQMLEGLNSQPQNSRVSNLLNLIIDDFYSSEEPWYLTFCTKRIINQTHQSFPSPLAPEVPQGPRRYPLPRSSSPHSDRQDRTSSPESGTNSIFWGIDFCDSYTRRRKWKSPGRERRGFHSCNSHIQNCKTGPPWNTHNSSCCTCSSNNCTARLQFSGEAGRGKCLENMGSRREFAGRSVT